MWSVEAAPCQVHLADPVLTLRLAEDEAASVTVDGTGTDDALEGL